MSDNISSGTVSVYLNRLTNATLQDFNGKKCMVIPIEDNNIYISDKGTVMLAMFMEKLNTNENEKKTKQRNFYTKHIFLFPFLFCN